MLSGRLPDVYRVCTVCVPRAYLVCTFWLPYIDPACTLCLIHVYFMLICVFTLRFLYVFILTLCSSYKGYKEYKLISSFVRKALWDSVQKPNENPRLGPPNPGPYN